MKYFIRSSKDLGHSLKRIRSESNLTQEKMAERLDTSQKTISRIENGGLGVVVKLLFKMLSALDYEIELHPRKVGTKQDIADMFR